jgi:hypothetical protein
MCADKEPNCGSSSIGRALAFQARCREFEPRLPLYNRSEKRNEVSFISLERLQLLQAVVAQGQSTSLVRKRSWVQFPSTALSSLRTLIDDRRRINKSGFSASCFQKKEEDENDKSTLKKAISKGLFVIHTKYIF